MRTSGGLTSAADVGIRSGDVTVPATYDTGGIDVDLSAVFGALEYFHVAVEDAGALPGGVVPVVTRAGAVATVRLVASRYDKTTGVTLSTPTDLPGGTSVASAAFSVSSPTSITSASNVDTIGGTGQALRQHLHGVDKLIEHKHTAVPATTATDAAAGELANGASLAGVALRWLAVGTPL